MGPRTIAFLVEEDAFVASPAQRAAGDLLGDHWLLGVVSGSVQPQDGDRWDGTGHPALTDPLPVAEAIAWATANADAVLLRDGDEHHFGIGIEGDDDEPIEPWRPELAARFVRRRAAAERWKDRTPHDPPIAWEVEALLCPRKEVGPDRIVHEPCETDAEAFAAIARWAPEAWSDEAVRDYRELYWRGVREAERDGSAGWFTWGDPRWRLTWTVTAATAELAAAPLRARLVPPEGWEVHVRAEPAEPVEPAAPPPSAV